MARHAPWRSLPGDPRTLLGWAMVDLDRQLQPVREGLGCFAWPGAIALFAFGHPAEAVVLMIVGAVLPALRRKPRSVEPLLTLPAIAMTYPCGVDVLRDGATIGTDRGAATFLDGWLHFEGFRTSFSLSRKDVVRRTQNRLELSEGGVEFRPDAPQSPFASALDRWYRLDRAAEGVSVLPPMGVHPSGVALAGTKLALGFVKLALVLGAVLEAGLLFGHSAWFVFFFGGPGDLLDGIHDGRTLRRLSAKDRKILANETKAAMGP